ncbi:unnamed protein product, partial [Gadus morhua 'NCC']
MVLFETTHELVLQVALTSPSYCLLNSLLLFPGMRPFSSGSCSLAYSISEEDTGFSTERQRGSQREQSGPDLQLPEEQDDQEEQ